MLPIQKYKSEIIEAVRNNYVTIISAETGAGKSTQIPQYLAGIFPQVIVTEPRIIAVKTLARRVSDETGEPLGKVIGYKTGYEKYFSKKSRIIYCTDGVQIVKSLFNEDVETERVLIIDEVHEWNLNIETLVAWSLWMREKWNTKVVIMSATIDVESIAQYFGNDVATLEIPGTNYNVEVEEKPASEFISTIKENIQNKKDILVFVAGKPEIKRIMQELSEEDAMLLPLHSELDWNEQKKCFEQYNKPKVIVSTNIAQTSITPNVDVVIDSGEVKMSCVENGIQGLYIRNISIADILQRKGRAGRTKDGKYILCSDIPIKERKRFSLPEIQRSILDRTVLQLATIGLDAEELKFYHQPSKESIKAAKQELIVLGAIDATSKNVTELGKKMVRIPVSVQLARMIVEAEKYGVTESVLTIAAIVQMGGLLARDGKYEYFTNETNSDLLAELDVWNYLKKIGYIDFARLKVKKRTFFAVKKHIFKLKDTLNGIVKISYATNREHILKSCLSGWISHVYVRESYNEVLGKDNSVVKISYQSCILNPKNRQSSFIIGMPSVVEYKDTWNDITSREILVYASNVSEKLLMELMPNDIAKEIRLKYLSDEDAVEVTINNVFRGRILEDTVQRYIDYNHPQYEALKAEYMEEMCGYRRRDCFNRQRVVKIDDKMFDIQYFNGKAVIYLDDHTLFNTKIKELFLENGERVYFSSYYVAKEEPDILTLQSDYLDKHLKNLREKEER